MRRYLDWVRAGALPVWAERGFDAAAGRFRERLDAKGAALPVPHRAMVQARQIYVYAHATELGWFDGAALVDRALHGLRRDFLVEAGGQASFHFSINGAGAVHSPVRDAYTHAFVLFALAWAHRVTGDPAALALADRVIAYVEADLGDPAHGGLFDAAPVVDRTKRQNPLMHLLEAYLFLAQAAPGGDYLARADALVALFRDRLFQADRGVLLEYFAPDWGAHPDPAKADRWEPGHHFEWAWLLGEHGRLTGGDHGRWIAALYDRAVAQGIAADGLVVDELTADGRVAKPSHRVWPHTEAIKAMVARGDRPAANRMALALLDHFLDRPFAGGWIDQLAADGRPLVVYVPASSLYHLFLAAAVAAPAEPAAG